MNCEFGECTKNATRKVTTVGKTWVFCKKHADSFVAYNTQVYGGTYPQEKIK